MEGLLENVRQLSRELRQHMLIIDQFIPPEYQVFADFFSLLCKFCSNNVSVILAFTVAGSGAWNSLLADIHQTTDSAAQHQLNSLLTSIFYLYRLLTP